MVYGIVKLYMTVRIHHSLKVSNTGMTYGHKKKQKQINVESMPRLNVIINVYIMYVFKSTHYEYYNGNILDIMHTL